jgi:O-acetyl-ADP-ribose deacetylase (regulator of RNase III)
MIKVVKDDIFNSDAEVLVNPVNCVGVMGAGLAKKFKEKYPHNFYVYKKMCEGGQLQLGRPLFVNGFKPPGPKYIANFPTKNHWKDKSNYKDIKEGLEELYKLCKFGHVETLAIPMLGCGLGGLKWSKVKKMIIEEFDGRAGLTITIHEYEETR